MPHLLPVTLNSTRSEELERGRGERETEESEAEREEGESAGDDRNVK